MSPEPARHAQLERGRRWASWALSCWRDFPADTVPRPLVIGASVRVERGFRTREAKIAFRRGELVGTDEVPDDVLEIVSQAGVADAPPGVEVAPLEITRAAREVSEFMTDRGRRSLDAWRLSGPGLLGDMIVLDPALACTRWAPASEARPPRPFDGTRHLELRAVAVVTSGAELAVSFVGAPAALSDYPDAEVVESPAAFTVLPRARPTAAYEQDKAVAAVGVFRQGQVRLAMALGGRVLVDLDGSACVVDRDSA